MLPAGKFDGNKSVWVHNKPQHRADDDGYESIYRAVSSGERKAIEGANGLSLRPGKTSNLGITLESKYMDDLITRYKGGRFERRYKHIVEFRVKKGTFDRLRRMSGTHSSTRSKYPDLRHFDTGMNIPQLKFEAGGVESILLGNSASGMKLFNDMILNIKFR